MTISNARACGVALVMAALLGLVSGYQLLGVSRDYYNYLTFFGWLDNRPLLESLEYRFESGFILLSVLLDRLYFTNIGIYCVIAGLAFFVKYLAFDVKRNFIIIFLVFTIYYLLRYFILFEMTVLRASVAMSLAFYVFYSRNRYEVSLKHFLILLVATSMHLSAIVFIPIYLIRPSGRVVVIGSALFLFFSIVIAKYVAFELLTQYIPHLAFEGHLGTATLLPVPYAFDLAFLVFVLVNWHRNDCLMKTCALGMAVGAAFHFGALDFAIVAARFRELLSIFYLLFVVRAVCYPRTYLKYGSLVFASATAVLHLYVMFIHDPLLT